MTSMSQNRDPNDPCATARLLCRARAKGTLVDIPDALKPRSLDQAYAAQAAYIGVMGRPVRGWKIGATGRESQQKLGLHGPFFGPVFEGDIYTLENSIPLFRKQDNFLETEICLRLNEAVQFQDLAGALSPGDLDISIAPAFEIVTPRFEGGLKDAGPMAIVDGGVNHAVIVGEFMDGRSFDPSRLEAQLSINDQLVAEGDFRALIWQDLLEPLSWLLARPELPVGQLNAGCLIMTGTMTGAIPITGGDQVEAHVSGLGALRGQFKES